MEGLFNLNVGLHLQTFSREPLSFTLEPKHNHPEPWATHEREELFHDPVEEVG